MTTASRRALSRFAHCAAALITCAGSALSAPVVINLGVMPGGTYSGGGVVSADGNVVTGLGDTTVGSGSPVRPFRWVYPTGPMTVVPVLGTTGSQGLATSATGAVIAGADNSRALRWTISGPLNFAPLAGGTYCLAAAISADGSTLAGQSNSPQGNRAVKWTAAGVIANLGVLPGALPSASSVALGISPDGSTVVGVSGTNVNAVSHAFRWTSGVMTDLGVLATGTDSAAVDMSADNSTIVGTSNINFNSNNERAFRWKAASGMYNLGVLPSGLMSRANAVNGNGFAIIGRNYDLNVGWRAFIWTPSNGIVDLKSYVIAHGGNTTGWTFDNAEGISDDGTAISGSGTFNGQTRAFLIRGLPCPTAPGWTSNPVDLTIGNGPGVGPCYTATLSNDAEVPDPLECTYGWSIESPANSGVHVELTGPEFFEADTGLTFAIAGWNQPHPEISGMRIGTHIKDIRFIPWVTNPCGTATATLTLTVNKPCNLADITAIGGTAEAPGCADEQLTVDDVIVFINLFSDGTGCPAGPGTLGACSKSDVCGIGGPPEGPDGQLSVDDIIAFFNAFSDGC